ncbi:unnamed protein product [Oppiella nova]|nr:unnamed protein product [Oppiella nova]CAG2181648.1 unnamed protein product [Oppiella nova]
MLSYLVIMFAVCWLPIRVFFLVVIFNKQMIDFKTTLEYHIYVFAFFGAHFLAMFNSCVNPIVYCFVSKNFRDDFWEIMAKTRLKIFRKTPQNPLNRKPIESTEL